MHLLPFSTELPSPHPETAIAERYLLLITSPLFSPTLSVGEGSYFVEKKKVSHQMEMLSTSCHKICKSFYFTGYMHFPSFCNEEGISPLAPAKSFLCGPECHSLFLTQVICCFALSFSLSHRRSSWRGIYGSKCFC